MLLWYRFFSSCGCVVLHFMTRFWCISLSCRRIFSFPCFELLWIKALLSLICTYYIKNRSHSSHFIYLSLLSLPEGLLLVSKYSLSTLNIFKQRPHLWGKKLIFAFSGWIISFNMIFCFINFSGNDMILFTFMTEQYMCVHCVCIYCIFFTYFSVAGHLDWAHVFITANSTAVNVCVPISIAGWFWCLQLYCQKCYGRVVLFEEHHYWFP